MGHESIVSLVKEECMIHDSRLIAKSFAYFFLENTAHDSHVSLTYMERHDGPQHAICSAHQHVAACCSAH